MSAEYLRAARQNAGWSQQTTAARLGVSQPYYSQLESGVRTMPSRLALRAVRRLSASPELLPLPPLAVQPVPVPPDELASALARLGYEGFAHTKKQGKPMNPAQLVAGALAHSDLDVRLVEALPWVLATYHRLDWTWLTAQCRLWNAQNRLAYLTSLAREVAAPEAVSPLNQVLAQLETSRLATEGTLCRDSMPDAERTWVRSHRSPEAEHWALLTSLTREQLAYAA